MSAHPCEARKYLGLGLQDGGGGAERLCPDPISYRFTFRDSEGGRAAIAYLCPAHGAEVIALLLGAHGTPGGMAAGMVRLACAEHERQTIITDMDDVPAVQVSAYRPRTDERQTAHDTAEVRA